MGTFHQDKGELHGITVVVDTTGSKVYIGRCDTMTDQGIILLDVDEHEDGKDGKSKTDFIQKAAKFGAWKKHEHFAIPKDEIAFVKPLGEFAAG